MPLQINLGGNVHLCSHEHGPVTCFRMPLHEQTLKEMAPWLQPSKFTFSDFYQFAETEDRNFCSVAHSHQFITLQE